MRVTRLLFVLLLGPLSALDNGQGVRSHTRPNQTGTAVSREQAIDLTLTVTPVVTRPIQVWVRTAGRLDAGARVVTATVSQADASFVKAGQRVRAFPIEARSSMYQGRVLSVATSASRSAVQVALLAPPREGAVQYVLEIVTDRGDFLSIPNEALIEEGVRRVVYVQRQEGRYEPQTVTIGIQGELYSQVLSGVRDGDHVVTFGSFFIDAEYKLKGTAQQP